MFLFRAAFWLVVLTLFLPPEHRPLPFIEFKLPARLGSNSDGPRAMSIPDNSYCRENTETCESVATTLDQITAYGLVGLRAVRSAVDESDFAARSDDDDDDDGPSLLGRLIDS